MAGLGVGPVQGEQIREAGNHQAEVGRAVVVVPLVPEPATAHSDDVDRR